MQIFYYEFSDIFLYTYSTEHLRTYAYDISQLLAYLTKTLDSLLLELEHKYLLSFEWVNLESYAKGLQMQSPEASFKLFKRQPHAVANKLFERVWTFCGVGA